jgi:hypothetical protein
VENVNVSRNAVSFVLSVPAGILLLLKGVSGPTETYRLLLDYLSSGIITDEMVQSVITAALLVLITISSLGGLAVLAGGFLIWKNHVFTGKLLISLGAGVGALWVVFLLITVVTTGEFYSTISEYSLVGWSGLILAFLARLIAK